MLFQHKSTVVRGLSWIPVALVSALIALEYVVFIRFHIRAKLILGDDSFALLFEFLAFNSLTALTVISYYRVITTDPGFVNDPTADFLRMRAATAGIQLPMCRSCLKPKPSRAHHCSVCRMCVVKMDHHCPWVGNCVGLRNYKFFFLFVTYGAITCGLILLRLFDQFIAAVHHMDNSLPLHGVLAYVMAASVTLSLTLFVCFHSYLISNGQTTLELNVYGTRSPYKYRTIADNWRAVFGTQKHTWFLPLVADDADLDYLKWTRNHELPVTNRHYDDDDEDSDVSLIL
ncbi:Aste57867_22072 [Aphanomyces stellatus]|uniref:Palmitoyltransferase n=1 Tax=Aphanomyces stellatus TaxID=120398 RepID=A0A485LKK6_9STRA|nr:hypothetical protein As57867_022003 [Aphanomyces stellatus]VFT98740.1 Aste57867_22072 [Aphanomyces stellatus]